MGRGDETASSDVIVRCSWCGKIYKVHTDRLPAGVSTFSCRGCGSPLPLIPLPRPDEEAEVREGAPTILVAVGEEDLAELIRKILQEKGYRVLLGSTGEETLRVIEENPVDILLISVFFPDFMGFEILEKVHQREGAEPIPSILLSSIYHGVRYKRAPTSLYGANDYIERHHLPDLLIPKIENLLKGEVSESPPETPPPTGPLSDEQVLQKRELEEIERSPQEEGGDQDHEVRRFCRVIAGDIVLYNEDRIKGSEPSRLLEALRDDLAEGDALLEGKFGQAGKEAAEWLREEVTLLVQMRGAQDS